MLSIHERTLASKILVPAALVCPKTCDTVAEDAFLIASHHSISHMDLLDKRERSSRFPTVRKQTCQKTNLFKWEAVSFPSLGSKSFLDTICRAQQRAACKCIWANACLRKAKKLNLQNM